MRLIIENLRRDFVGPDGSRVPVVNVPALTIEAGEQVGLLGRSGSGKTTLMYLIAGIQRADSGAIVFEGEGKKTDLVKLSEAERDSFRGRHIGYIFQTHHLLPAFTALENVLLGMSFTGRPADEGWAKHLLNEVGLGDRLGYRPGKLSVGQQQRVAVARALANRPALVLADEPTGALDATNAQQVLELIRKLCGEVNAILLLVTHDLALAKQLPRQVSLADFAPMAVGGTR
jgi:putative ABC transport system ATP-binding protein